MLSITDLSKKNLEVNDALLEGKHKGKSELYIRTKKDTFEELYKSVKKFFYSIIDMNSYKVPVNFEQIQGKVVMRVPKIGYLKYFLVDYYGWIIAVVIPSLGIIFYDIYKLFKNVKNSKAEKKNKERVMALEE